MRSLVGIVVVLSLLFFNAVEGSHAHTGTDLSAVCSVCELGHQGVQTATADTQAIVELGLLRAPALFGHQLISSVVHLSPHRSRAPPLPISL
ncbi:MAG: hypothetical protein OXU74_00895 [Gemmatimonadota bacterium]|nr:hypothetical protein [Gemmatimonadota bacterium]